MYEIDLSESLRKVLKKLYRKNRVLYKAVMKKMNEVVLNPEHYKNLRYDMSDYKRVHVGKHFVLFFTVEANVVKFNSLLHHDKAY